MDNLTSIMSNILCLENNVLCFVKMVHDSCHIWYATSLHALNIFKPVASSNDFGFPSFQKNTDSSFTKLVWGSSPRPYGYPQTCSCQISSLLPVQKSQQNPMAVLSHTQIYILTINYFSEIKNLPWYQSKFYSLIQFC